MWDRGFTLLGSSWQADTYFAGSLQQSSLSPSRTESLSRSFRAVVLKVGGANTLQGGRDVTDGEKKTTADLSLVSESSLSGEIQGAGLTQTNEILFGSGSTNQNGVL